MPLGSGLFTRRYERLLRQVDASNRDVEERGVVDACVQWGRNI